MVFAAEYRLLVLAWCVSLCTARAAVIPGLFATGVDDAGNLLPAGAVDPHWKLVQSADPSARGPNAYVVNEGWPIPPWIANGPHSKWIAPKADQSNGNFPGDYIYRLTFDLTGFDPGTARITGRWSSDNTGAQVRINGQVTGITYDGNFGAFSAEFTISSGFVDGTNTIEFVVNNAGDGVNPTGFRAELQGTADLVAPPGTPPQITRQPESTTVSFKETAVFNVSVYGSRPLAYQWRHAGRSVPGATNAALLIPFASVGDIGLYDVVVTNVFGMATSAPATLALTFPNPTRMQREPPGPSNRRTGIVITEIMYHPTPRTDGRNIEFIELYNSNPFSEDLGGWRLTGEIEFTFPNGTVIPGTNYLVVAAKAADIKAVYGITNVVGNWSGKLANEGGPLKLCKASGAVLLEINYQSKPPWPLAAAGAGHSLVLARASFGEGDPRAWAASAASGGSPGSEDPTSTNPADNLVINEVLSVPGQDQTSWIELHNAGARPVDASNCILTTDPATQGFVIPAGTVLGGNEFLVLGETQTGLSLSRSGGRLFLFTPDRTRVLDAVGFGACATGSSQGRSPFSPGALRELQSPTPKAPNAPPRLPDVVISEIMFNPLSGDNRDEFVELHNRGTNAIDLSGWRFVDGIEFVFPPGATLPAGGWVVVVPDTDRFRAKYPDVPESAVFGNFSGALSDRGERIALAKPVYHPGSNFPVWGVAAEAYYRDAAPGSRWADGGGSSLELIDLRADPLDPDNWIDSDESAKADWTLIESTGVLDHVHPAFPATDQLQVMLLGAGEALLDAVDVRTIAGPNLIGNGQFEFTTSPWVFQGTHRLSRREPNTGFNSSSSLRIVATERGDHVANRIRVRLSSQISAGQVATIRARAKWLAGHPEILLRLRGGGLEASGRLITPNSPGTPGKQNSRTTTNAGPAVRDVLHKPILPAPQQPVRVMARVYDPDGISTVTLHFHRDQDREIVSVSMVDDGSGPDELANDGIYTGAIPGQTSGTIVAFTIEAADASTPGATTVFPAGPQTCECLIRWGEPTPNSAFGSYHIWIAKENHDFWANREKMSNEDVPVTFVYGSHRVIYSAGARYSGSSYTAPGYNSPTGNLCGYDVTLPKFDRFLGDTHITLDWPIRDDTDQREALMYRLLDWFGLPNMYRRYVLLFVNGLRRGVIYDDAQQPGADTVEEWFSHDSEGTLWKTDCWNEFDDAGNRIDPCILNTLENFTSADGSKKIARYRWNWRPRAVHGSANDFTDLFALVDTVNAKSDYISRVESVIDLDHWMRTFAMNDLASFWDALGNPNAKNTFLYKPKRDRWKLMCWDFDVGLGVFNDPPDAPLFDVNDPTIARMYQTPAMVRLYWAALEEALDTWFNVGQGSPIDSFLDSRYAAFRADGLALAPPDSIKSWITQRRAFLLNQIKSVRADFVLTSPATTISTNQNPLVLRGKAPVRVRTLAVNGVEYPVTWTTVTSWELRIPLNPGQNKISIAAYDYYRRPIGTLPELSVTYTGTPTPIPAVRINEWMASNRNLVVDPADNAFDDWFELYNPGNEPVSLAGWFLTDSLDQPARFIIPSGFILPPRGFIIVWADNQPEQSMLTGQLHTNFQLQKNGETIALFYPDGRLVDVVHFDSQPDNASQGRWPDGAPEPFFSLWPPTPAAPNTATPSTLPHIRIVSVSINQAGTVAITWSALPGRFYEVHACADLASRDWQKVSETIQSNGDTAGWIDTSPNTAEQRFYLIKYALAP